MSLSQPARRHPDASDSRFADRRDAGAELDNILRLSTAAAERPTAGRVRPQAPPASEPRRITQADLDTALTMLNRAAQAMDILQDRYQQVEGYAREIAERAERDLSLAYGQRKEWEARAMDGEARIEEMKGQLEDAERRAEAARRQSEKAERAADAADQRADQAERAASEAREWLECFHDRIVTFFEARPSLKSAAA